MTPVLPLYFVHCARVRSGICRDISLHCCPWHPHIFHTQQSTYLQPIQPFFLRIPLFVSFPLLVCFREINLCNLAEN